MRKIIAGCLMLAALAGCSTSTPFVLPPAKSIVIVPAITKNFRVATTGITVFQNNLDIIDDSSWHLNQLAYDTAVKVLSPAYQVSEASPDAALWKDLNGWSFFEPFNIGNKIKQHVHVTSLPDLFLFISISDPPPTGEQYPDILRAVGISKQRVWVTNITPVAHAYLELSVIDGRTFRVLDQAPLSMPQKKQAPKIGISDGTFFYGGGGRLPIAELDNFPWRDHWADLTAAEQHEAEDTIRNLITASESYTLTQVLAGRAQ
ncbi:MAG: hypothetical protein KGJ73_12615 [Rhodospirillales bacterium]|nr:hypothetical protein [Rhodospirillales bacterium]